MRAALLMLGATVGLLGMAKPLEPYDWGHRLSEGCSWAPRASAGLLGAEEMDRGAQRAEFACWHRHGARAPGPLPVLQVIGRKWPTEAELTAWNQ